MNLAYYPRKTSGEGEGGRIGDGWCGGGARIGAWGKGIVSDARKKTEGPCCLHCSITRSTHTLLYPLQLSNKL